MAALNTGTSIVDYLKSVGQDSSYTSRATLAAKAGIQGYSGAADQNVSLLNYAQGIYSKPAPAPASPINATPAPVAPTTTASITSPTQVKDTTQANGYINGTQSQDQSTAQQQNEPPVRSSAQVVIDALSKLATGTATAMPAAPAVPDLAKQFTDLKTTYNIDGLEQQMNDLDKQEQDAQAQLRANTVNEQGKPVAMNVIEGRVSEQTRQAQDNLDFITRQKTYISNQLQTKYKTIDTLMKLTDSTYDNSKAAYDSQFTQTLSLINSASAVDEKAKTDADRAADNARANAQIVINAAATRGVTYADMTPDQKVSLSKLGIESGLGADFFSSVLEKSSGKEILTQVVSADQTKMTIVYKDGTTKLFATGLPAKPLNDYIDSPTTVANKTSIFTAAQRNKLGETIGVDLGNTIAQAILNGATLEQIREGMRNQGIDTKSLDTFDRIIGIESLLKTAKSAVKSS